MASASSPASSRFRSILRSQWLSIGLVGLAFVLLWLDLFSLPLAPVSPALDSSWCGALIHFSTLKLQFGRDIVFTYGPLSHLISFVYTGELFTARVIWGYASTTLFAAILCATLVSLPRLWRLVFFLFVLLFIWVDPISDALYFLVITCLTALLFQHGASRISLNALAGALFGICSLIKFTYFLVCVFALLLLALFYLSRSRPAGVITPLVSFLGSILLCWRLAGQAYSNFPSYIATSLDISFGYKEAMGLPAASVWIVAAGVAAALLALAQCSLMFLNAPRLPVLCVILFYTGETFLSWNRAFIRADDHVLSFFGLCPVAVLTLWVAVKPIGIIKRIGYAVNFLILLICLSGIFLQRSTAITRCVPDAISRMTGTYRIAAAPGITAQRLRLQLMEAKAANALPRVKAAVGNETIDVFGYEQGTALLNDLNYTPRPTFQSYSAYTTSLIAANTAFYSSPQAPPFVLFKYQPIDNRYSSLDDAGVLRQLLFNYTPLFEEQGYALWKRSSDARPIPTGIISTKALLFDEVYPLPPGKNLWLELDIQKSFRGRLRSLLYKPPKVEIWVIDSQGRQIVHRLIPSMSSSGFIINPQLETSKDVLETAHGLSTTSVVSFLVHTPRESRRFFQRRVVCRLVSLPEFPATALDRSSRRARLRAVLGEQDPQLALRQAFDASKEILLSAGPGHFEDFSSLNEVKLNHKGTGLQIVATGSDPQILLPRFTPRAGMRAILRIDLDVPTDTGLQLFYLPAGVSAYGHHIRNQSVYRGGNTLYFALTDSELAGGPLRLDPGMVPGDYLITHFEIRSTPADPISSP